MGTANNVYVEETALGIIPRVVRHIFAVKQARTEQIISQLSRQKEQGNTAMRPLAASLRHDNHAHMQLRVSYIEIYNESLRDLLYPDTDPRSIVIRENAKVSTQGCCYWLRCRGMFKAFWLCCREALCCLAHKKRKCIRTRK